MKNVERMGERVGDFLLDMLYRPLRISRIRIKGKIIYTVRGYEGPLRTEYADKNAEIRFDDTNKGSVSKIKGGSDLNN